jgi:uncharacterized delta-60 repeat protein
MKSFLNPTGIFKKRVWIGKINVLVQLTIIIGIVFPTSLSAQVDTAWVRRYNGPEDSSEWAFNIALDDSGYVFVSGSGERTSNHNKNYITIKYYPSGDTAWVRRYELPGNGYNDYVRDMALDGLGNIYVTGTSEDVDTNDDYLTIKYYPNGDTAWVRRYDGPEELNDLVSALAIDHSGNIYVTGTSWSSSTHMDYATVKYYPTGDTAWVRRYNGPINDIDEAYAIDIDSSNYIYVTGTSRGSDINNPDFLTIKYYPNGDTAWVRRFDDGPGGWDQAYALTHDNSGNVYVTGRCVGIGTAEDYATIKYYPNGDTAWVRRYDGGINNLNIDYAKVVKVDNSGNVYVTGNSQGSGGLYDIVTIKYYPNGDTAWVRRYNGPENSVDEVSAAELDNSGNVYITGTSVGVNSHYDYLTIKYNPNGDMAWVGRYNGPGNGNDYAQDLVLNAAGNIYVTGSSADVDSDYDFTTIKYIQTGDIEERPLPESFSGSTIESYPNPARNYFTIRLPGSDICSMIKLFDISGKKIKEITGKNRGVEHQIPLTGINPGVYFVQINNGKTLKKLVIIR